MRIETRKNIANESQRNKIANSTKTMFIKDKKFFVFVFRFVTIVWYCASQPADGILYPRACVFV